MSERLTVMTGDCIEQMRRLPAESVQCCVTSPPYWGLRDYGHAGQLGLEKTPTEFIAKMVEVFEEVRHVLKPDGTLWMNMGDSYNGSGLSGGKSPSQKGTLSFRGAIGSGAIGFPGLKPKDLCGMPWRVAFALQEAGWWLRSDIIWHKPNPMPESVTDRPTKAHEYIFLLTKSERYYYDADAIREPHCAVSVARKQRAHSGGKYLAGSGGQPSGNVHSISLGMDDCLHPNGANKRTVWTVPTQPYADAHFATYPPDLIKPCIMAGTKPGDVVLDPFGGSGTTGQVALELGRKALLIELNPEYVKLIQQRCNVTPGLPLS